VKKTQNIVNYSGIGQVLYVRNPRARNFTIRINQRGEVRVTVPGRVGWRRAEVLFFIPGIMGAKESWSRCIAIPAWNHLPSEGESIRIRGREFPISLQRGDSGIEDAIWRILRNEAREYLPGRVAKLSEMHGYRISGLKIRKMKTRWGSCTSRKSINLNSWLMMVPEPLRDYVILHELAHTRFPNHGSQFWKELDRTTGGLSDMYRKELRKQKIMCFAGTKADQ
jgi:predicted metal-dependent hydrolase